MAQRTVCLCEGKYIGIETIYTIVNGQQINIPEKLKALRIKSQNNQLFCPCGCGSNLILVAGDRNLREQHFRVKDGKFNQCCSVVTEGKCSVNSKIVLKCWLDDKLHDENIESRVPIYAVDDINRKYEFTLLSKKSNIAISYCHDRANLSDAKMNILESNAKDIKIIYVVDAVNGGAGGQYPEGLMKIQDRQGYCLYISVVDSDYYKAEMRAAFYIQDIDGMWKEITLSDGKINSYDIDRSGNLLFNGQPISGLLIEAKNRVHSQMENERARRAKEEQQRAEKMKRLLEEQEKKYQEYQKRLEEQDKERQFLQEEAKKRKAEIAEKKKNEEEKQQEEKRKREEVFKQAMADNFTQQNEQIRDADGNRWIKCEFCGKIAMESKFRSYGGLGHVNLGICYECSKTNPAVQKKVEKKMPSVRKKYEPNICPECGGSLVEKNGQFGVFMGCSNYPKCRYTRRIKK